MNSTFLKDDVILLLKDISGLVEPLSTAEREKYIQSGIHYSEMLPLEYAPSDAYIKEYYNALKSFSEDCSDAAKILAHKIIEAKGKDVVLVSFARAGIPIAIILKRVIRYLFNIDVPHYAISIIRGKGIDKNAINFIVNNHDPKNIQFVDGWTGKGAILSELKKEMLEYNGISSELAVLADPAGIAKYYGTDHDLLIASSCLNATICGLISRTFYKRGIIGEKDFHGAAYYGNLIDQDRTYEFIDTVLSHIVNKEININFSNYGSTGLDEVIKIAKDYGISDINLIKPGLGEATRVLLRREPHVILINENAENIHVSHLIELAKEKNIPVKTYPLRRYNACGIIKDLAADV